MMLNKLFVTLGILLVAVSASNPNYNKTLALQPYYNNCYELYPSAYSLSPNGKSVIGVTCGTSGERYLLELGADNTLLLNYTYKADEDYNDFDSGIWALDDTIYACGRGSDPEIPEGYLFRVDSYKWDKTRKWRTTPHLTNFSADYAEATKCYWLGDSILYKTYNTVNYTIGMINITDGSILRDALITLPSYHQIDAVLYTSGAYKIVGKSWKRNPQIFYNDLPNAFYVTYNYVTNQLGTVAYYDIFSTTESTSGVSLSDISLLLLGDYYAMSYCDLSKLKCTIHQLATNGTILSSRTLSDTSFLAMTTISSYLAVLFKQSSTTMRLVFFDADLTAVQDYPGMAYKDYTIVLQTHISKDALVYSLGAPRQVELYSANILPQCPTGFTSSDSGTCVACNYTCKTCSATDDQSCTSCANGLIPFDSTAHKYNCTLYGSDISIVQCIKSFAASTISTLQIEGSAKVGYADFIMNFNKNVRTCSGSAFSADIFNGTANISLTAEQLWQYNYSSVGVSLTADQMNKSCSNSVVNSLTSTTCTIYIYMIGALTGMRGASYKINMHVYSNVTNTTGIGKVVISSSYNTYENNTSINRAASLAVNSRACLDLACTSYGVKQAYSLGEIMSVSHCPSLPYASVTAVSKIEVTFTSDGTTKNATSYLQSSTIVENCLNTKIKLLDSSGSPLVLTFYVQLNSTKGSGTRLLTVGDYVKTSFKFLVLDEQDMAKFQECKGSVLECQGTGLVLAILGGSFLFILATIIILYYMCRKKHERQADLKEPEMESPVGRINQNIAELAENTELTAKGSSRGSETRDKRFRKTVLEGIYENKAIEELP